MTRYEVELIEMDGPGACKRVEVYDKAKGAKGLYEAHAAHYWFAVYVRQDDGIARWLHDSSNIVMLGGFLRSLMGEGVEITWMPSTRPWLEQFGEGWKEL